jgi:hypothetical protein
MAPTVLAKAAGGHAPITVVLPNGFEATLRPTSGIAFKVFSLAAQPPVVS